VVHVIPPRLSEPLLYLDFDGVLHPADVRVTEAEPLQPRVYNGAPTDHPLFEHAALLERILMPFTDVKIVLSTSWVRVLGYEYAVQQLPTGLQARVIGTIWQGELAQHPPRTRYDAIQSDATARGLTSWLALDDDLEGWPEEQRYHLIAPNNSWRGLGQAGRAEELAEALALLCAGRPLEARLPQLAHVPSTVERLFGSVEPAQLRRRHNE
jgi:hypothetical protein